MSNAENIDGVGKLPQPPPPPPPPGNQMLETPVPHGNPMFIPGDEKFLNPMPIPTPPPFESRSPAPPLCASTAPPPKLKIQLVQKPAAPPAGPKVDFLIKITFTGMQEREYESNVYLCLHSF
jgi:hypothetical protein